MCGRYVVRMQEKYLREWQIYGPPEFLRISYNVAPTQRVPIVRWREGRLAGSLGIDSVLRRRRASTVLDDQRACGDDRELTGLRRSMVSWTAMSAARIGFLRVAPRCDRS